MDKSQTAPSGDRHDYYSQSIYAWPNPSTANGLPWVTRDGQRNPAVDAISDAREWSHLVDAMNELSLAWFYTYDARYAERAALILRVWFLDPATHMKPDLRYAQLVPGASASSPGGIIDFAELPVVVDAEDLLQSWPGWTARDELAFRSWLSDYLNWLQTSSDGLAEAGAANNHGTWYDEQVAAIAMALGRNGLARSTVLRTRSRIDTQIRPDGSQPLELRRATSWDYSVYNLRAFCRLAAIGQVVKVDLWPYVSVDGSSLKTAIDFLIPAATGVTAWTAGRQTKAFDATLALPVLHAAADAGDATAFAAVRKISPVDQQADPWLMRPAV